MTKDYARIDQESGYSLHVSAEPKANNMGHVIFRKSNRDVISGRSADVYFTEEPRLKDIPDDAHVVEIGAGISGYVDWLLRKREPNIQRRPTIIDNADYAAMQRLLERAARENSDHPLVSEYSDTLQEFLDRCKLFQDSQKVDLVNMPLEQAMEVRPDLLGAGDAVVDLYGPLYYTHRIGSTAEYSIDDMRRRIDAVLAQERSLLKLGGILLQK